jgi:predicted HTH transcriptional regulator
MIKNNPEITREQLATALSKSPDTIKKHIAKLKKTGKIVRIGPQTYGGKWKVIE